MNDSPEAITFSWEITTTPVNVNGHKPTSHLIVDTTVADAGKVTQLETKLYGDASSGTPTLPMPDEVYTMFQGE